MLTVVSLASSLYSEQLSYAHQKVDWLLSNTTNIELLEEGTYKIIKKELDKMTLTFNAKVDSLILYNYKKDYYGRVERITAKNIAQEETIDTFYPNWSEVVEFYGGYSKIANLGVTKENDLEKFIVKVLYKYIELKPNGICTAYIDHSGRAEHGLKLYDTDNLTKKYAGRYIIDKITFSDIFNMGDNYSNNTHISLSFNGKYSEELSRRYLITSINKEVSSIAISYSNTMTQMINDLVSDEFYDQMEHVKKQREIDERIAEEKRIEAERIAEEKRIEAERIAEERRIEAARIAEEIRIEKEQREKLAREKLAYWRAECPVRFNELIERIKAHFTMENYKLENSFDSSAKQLEFIKKYHPIYLTNKKIIGELDTVFSYEGLKFCLETKYPVYVREHTTLFTKSYVKNPIRASKIGGNIKGISENFEKNKRLQGPLYMLSKDLYYLDSRFVSDCKFCCLEQDLR